MTVDVWWKGFISVFRLFTSAVARGCQQHREGRKRERDKDERKEKGQNEREEEKGLKQVPNNPDRCSAAHGEKENCTTHIFHKNTNLNRVDRTH